MRRVIVIGAGSTGAATAHGLALRGFRVTVVERGAIASGTTACSTPAGATPSTTPSPPPGAWPRTRRCGG